MTKNPVKFDQKIRQTVWASRARKGAASRTSAESEFHFLVGTNVPRFLGTMPGWAPRARCSAIYWNKVVPTAKVKSYVTSDSREFFFSVTAPLQLLRPLSRSTRTGRRVTVATLTPRLQDEVVNAVTAVAEKNGEFQILVAAARTAFVYVLVGRRTHLGA